MIYPELHAHSCFSFLDGASQPEELAERAAMLGYETVALTDHDGLCGSLTFAPAAREVIQAFAAARAEHDGPAQKALGEARAAFQQGRRGEGYARYQEIVDKYYAAASYRNVKRWLAERE